ncbi:uncharacterized protein IL334_003429 [Kwoniella shivajii]|uniref:DUF7729 domain-containing protein n=1 Tax=Kwoniella shivajii TaxID=564305 RepID=A0ABZ1CZ72_9TREE|nr:hypothetical protein IL334_003429 [Kwoniella shivajii]
MKTHFILSLVLGLMMSNAAAHGHGIRPKRRINDPAKRNLLPLEEDSIIPQSSSSSSSSSSASTSLPSPTHSSLLSINETTPIHIIPRANTSYSASTSSSNSMSTIFVILPKPPSTPISSPPKPIPTPLDLSISKSLSSGCMVYLASLLSTSTFISCLPLSLLLTTSSGYSTILQTALSTGNYTTLNNLISYTSNPQFGGNASPDGSDQCDDYMQNVMSSLSSKSNCGTDIANGNLVAKEAKTGLGNYKLIKQVSTLIDDQSGVYCYLEAVNSKKPDDLYLWGIPSGISLPTKSTPTCSSCSRSLLNTYTAFTSTTPTLNSTLVSTAIKRVNEACGQGFVNLSAVTNTTSSSSSRIVSVNGSRYISLIIGFSSLLFILGFA